MTSNPDIETLKNFLKAKIEGLNATGRLMVFHLLDKMNLPYTMHSLEKLKFWEMKVDYLFDTYNLKWELVSDQLTVLRKWLIDQEHLHVGLLQRKYPELTTFLQSHNINQAGQFIALHVLIELEQEPTVENFCCLKPTVFDLTYLRMRLPTVIKYADYQVDATTLQSLKILLKPGQFQQNPYLVNIPGLCDPVDDKQE